MIAGNFFKFNAFHVLGLKANSTQKDIRKRAREILRLLAIGQVPHYSCDIPQFKNFRTEESVKNALELLSGARTKFREVFFWFSGEALPMEELVSYIEGRRVALALRVLSDRSSSPEPISGLAKKDMVMLLSMLQLYGRSYDPANLKESLCLWRELSSDEVFWKEYFKHYSKTDDFEASEEIVSEFRKSLKGDLSRLYSRIYRRHGLVEIVAAFREHFHLNNEDMEKEFYDPIYEQISDSLAILSEMSMNIPVDLGPEKKEMIWELIKKGRDGFERLLALGSVPEGRTLKMKDRFAGVVHSLAVGIFNRAVDRASCPELLGAAHDLAGTEAMKHKISQDRDRISAILSDHSMLAEKMVQLAKTTTFNEGYIMLSDAVREKFSGMELKGALEFYGQYFCLLYAENLYQKAVGNDIGTNYPFAFALFRQLNDFLADRSGMFKADREYIDKARELAEKARDSSLRLRQALDEVYSLSENICRESKKTNMHSFLRARFASVLMKAVLYDKAALRKSFGQTKKTDDPSKYFNMGTIYLLQKKYQRAIDDFSRSLETDSSNVRAYLSRAKAYEHIGLLEWAKDDLASATKIDPELASQLKKEHETSGLESIE